MRNTKAREVIETLSRHFFLQPTATLAASSLVFDDGRPLSTHLHDALDELDLQHLRDSRSARAHNCRAAILAIRKTRAKAR